jgi:hypothetical protein
MPLHLQIISGLATSRLLQYLNSVYNITSLPAIMYNMGPHHDISAELPSQSRAGSLRTCLRLVVMQVHHDAPRNMVPLDDLVGGLDPRFLAWQ